MIFFGGNGKLFRVQVYKKWENNSTGVVKMEDKEIKTPSYMKNVPFFFIAALFAPVAMLLVFLNWNKLTSQMRSNHLTFSILMTLLYISKILPDGTFKTVFSALTITLIIFVTYIFFGGGRKK